MCHGAGFSAFKFRATFVHLAMRTPAIILSTIRQVVKKRCIPSFPAVFASVRWMVKENKLRAL
jgi:hypothetical protein